MKLWQKDVDNENISSSCGSNNESKTSLKFEFSKLLLLL
jgi:hypothetical protein